MSAVHDLKTGEEIDPFDAAYRRVRAQYEAAKSEADRFGGPCDKCRHFRGEGGSLSNDYCHNPLVVSFGFDRANGKVVTIGHMIRSWSALTTHQKKPGIPDLCGNERRLWERRTSWQTFKRFSAAYWGIYAFAAPFVILCTLAAVFGS